MELLKNKVLVINRRWIGYEETNVAEALKDICRGASTGIDTSVMRAVTWDEWLKLPIREGDRFIRSLHGPVRVPTVICKAKYADMPKRAPKWSKRGVAKRDKYICQVTGQYAPDGSVDHLEPRRLRKTNRDTWDNTAWVRKDINRQKADRTLAELGWKLIRQPSAPGEQPMARLIPPRHEDWKPFLWLDR
jgi:hypothetical protein